MEKIRNEKKKMLFRFLLALGGLFAVFIMLCGNTHTLRVLQMIYPHDIVVEIAVEVMLWLCAGVSMITAVVGMRLFPLILEILSKFELNSEGKLESAQTYLLEVVEMVQESIMVISDDCVVERCNEASRTLFSRDVMGRNLRTYIHPEDAERFNQAVLRVLGGYNFAPATVEYRIKVARQNGTGDNSVLDTPKRRLPTAADIRVHCEMSAINDGMPDFSPDTVNMALNALAHADIEAAVREAEYVWIESTICKGMRLSARDDLEYDLKMASRNIEDRKRGSARRV
jgi:hypothetical protein